MRNPKFNDDFSDFDDQFERISKTVNTGFKFVFVAWIIGAIVSLAAIAGLAYVAVHFIQKAW